MRYHKILLSLIVFGCTAMACAQDQPRLKVAIFVHEGVQLLDFSGPGEVFKDAGFEVFAVAPDTTEITSQGFLKVRPNYSISNCPQPDIMVFPGGATGNAMSDDRVIEWIRQAAPKAQYVLSVCTGSLLIAKAGLLDGMTATTHYCCQESLAEFKKVTVVKDKRFVDNGKVITTEGISAGIDGSLYLVEKIKGRKAADDIAHYMMYNWQPDTYDILVIKP